MAVLWQRRGEQVRQGRCARPEAEVQCACSPGALRWSAGGLASHKPLRCAGPSVAQGETRRRPPAGSKSQRWPPHPGSCRPRGSAPAPRMASCRTLRPNCWLLLSPGSPPPSGASPCPTLGHCPQIRPSLGMSPPKANFKMDPHRKLLQRLLSAKICIFLPKRRGFDPAPMTLPFKPKYVSFVAQNKRYC